MPDLPGCFSAGETIDEALTEVVEAIECHIEGCLLYTSDAADERSSVDLGGRRIIKKKKYSGQSEERYRRKKLIKSMTGLD